MFIFPIFNNHTFGLNQFAHSISMWILTWLCAGIDLVVTYNC